MQNYTDLVASDVGISNALSILHVHTAAYMHIDPYTCSVLSNPDLLY